MKVRLDSYDDTKHSLERIGERISEMDEMGVGFEFSKGEYSDHGNFVFTEEIKEEILEKVNIICVNWFEYNKSYGIFLFDFNLNDNLEKIQFHTPIHKKDAKKQIKDGRNLFLISKKSESNGDLLFAIIRNRKLQTLMFVKSYMQNLENKLRVDEIVK
jgi:hypothetical protein